jgi:tetratricopeptide (TPR) repeat protein
MPDESWITNHAEDPAPRIDDAGLAPLLSPLFHSRVVADQHYQRGLDQESRGQWDRALASFRTACALHPERILYLLARGRICQTHDLDPEAADCYEHARRIAPRDPVVLFNQAELWARHGRLSMAVQNLEEILSDGSRYLAGRAMPVHRLRGDLALRTGDYSRADEAFRTALALVPEDAYLRAMVESVPRFAEFNRDAEEISPAKRLAYSQAGAMLFGLLDDDGVTIPDYPGIGLETLDEVASVIARPARTLQILGSPAYIGALDAPSRPIAEAITDVLGGTLFDPSVPLRTGTGGRPPVLLVTVNASDPETIGAVTSLLRAEGQTVWTYAIGLRHSIGAYHGVIDLISFRGFVEVPWDAPSRETTLPFEGLGAELASCLRRAIEALPTLTAVTSHLAWHSSHRRFASDSLRDAFAQSGIC